MKSLSEAPAFFKSAIIRVQYLFQWSLYMTTVAQLIAQKEALEAQIAAARKAENADAIAKVKALVAEHGLTQQDIFGGAKRGPKASGAGKVARPRRRPARRSLRATRAASCLLRAGAIRTASPRRRNRRACASCTARVGPGRGAEDWAFGRRMCATARGRRPVGTTT